MSVLQHDDQLLVWLCTDVPCGLDSTTRHERHHSGNDVAREVIAVRASSIGLGMDGNAIARDLNQQVVEVVPVQGAVFARREPKLPDTDSIILEHDLAADVTEDPFVTHAREP